MMSILILKCINKKKWTLFFVVSILTSFNFTIPMIDDGWEEFWLTESDVSYKTAEKETIKGVIDPCQQPSKGVIIKEVPDDCLCEIFQFFARRGEYGIGPSLALGLVCKDFKKVIDEKPCFLANIDGANHFLRFRFYNFCSDFMVKLYSEKMVDTFVDDMERQPALSNVRNNKFCIYIRLDESDYLTFFKPKLKQISSILEIKKNRLHRLNIEHNFSKPKKSIEFCNSWDHGINHKEASYYNKNNVSNKELNMFGDLQELCVLYCKNFGAEKIKWPVGLKELAVLECKKFNTENLKILLNLKELTIYYHDEFKGDELKELKNLETLTTYNCKKFSGRGLPKNLRSLTARDCESFGLKPIEAEALDYLYIDKCKNFCMKELGKLKNLQSLIVSDCKKNFDVRPLEKLQKLNKVYLYDVTDLKASDPSLEKLRLRGCEVII